MNRKNRSIFVSVLSMFALLLSAQNAGADDRPTYSPSRHDHDEGKLTPLSPHAHPYALAADSGIVNVRFSVRMMGKKNPATTVYLRQSGTQESIAMNNQGVYGDHRASDNIYGASIPVDTSTLAADSCLSYEAFINSGGTEVVSAPLQLCVSSFPVRTAAPNTAKPIVFPDGMKAVADEVLLFVTPTTSAATIRELAHSVNASVVGSIIPLNLYQLKLPSPVGVDQLMVIITKLNARAGVTGVSVNALGEPAGHITDITDPEFANQHGVKLVLKHPTLAGTYVWDAGAIGTGVTVVVADEGLDRTHPEFGTPGSCQVANNECGPGAINNDNSTPGYAQWHGTRVAGVIVAKAINGQGMAGVAHGSIVYSYKVASYALSDMDQIFTDVGNYVAMDGTASVINASFGGGPYFGVPTAAAVTSLCAAINTAVTSGSGAIVVNAVGNNNADGFYYPARCNEHAALLAANRNRLITVGNSTSVVTRRCGNSGVDQRCLTDLDDATKLGSNYGAWVEITAPGSDIRTTLPAGSYTSATGTSFSAPIVSGAVAILKSCGVPLDSIKSTLISSATVQVPYPTSASLTTTPRLDVYSALALVDQAPSAVNLSNTSLANNLNTSAGAEVGTLSKTDSDTCDKWAYSKVGGVDSALFSIGGANNDILILTAGVLNSAVKSSYSVTVRVTDFFGKTADLPVTVTVSAATAPPPTPANPPASSGGGGGGGGGCSVMPVGANPDSSLALAVLALLGYGVWRRISCRRGKPSDAICSEAL